MKLRTKICLMTITVLTVAMSIFTVVILKLTFSSNLNTTIQMEEVSADYKYNSINQSFIEEYDYDDAEIVKDTMIRYIGNQLSDEHVILVNANTQECLFNKTEYNPLSILKSKSTEKFSNRIVTIEGRQYLYLARKITDEGTYIFYMYKDITRIYSNIRDIAMKTFVSGIVILVVLSMVLAFSMRRTLYSLRILTEGTKQIANGIYDKVKIHSKDEVGQLANRFNIMSDAIAGQVEELKQEAENRKMLISALTHELKTPITSIKGYSQTLLITKLPSDQQEEMLSTIDTECSRLERLSQKMMGLIMITNQEDILLKKSSLPNLFERVEQSTRVLLGQDGITLQTKCEIEEVTVEEDLFLELLLNLVDNARKASKAGDTIMLQAKDNKIQIIDEGKGIPKEDLPKIKQAFYMGDKSRTSKKKGLGLGLALCDRIVELHHFSLDFESDLGKGTTVTIQL
ncbi:phosphate regulon sensor protein PhoR [Lachnospiraceae bacterium KM106-2]|nr:phosphate regulon sensor protein PhoR [Lachnospiraceae bacterium KM106-2]